jgi:O-antigen ligase
MTPLIGLALLLLALPLVVVAAVTGRRALLAVLPLLVTLNGVAIPVGGFAVRIDQVAALLLAGALLLGCVMGHRRPYVDPPMRWLAAFAVLNLVSSMLFSPDRGYSVTQVANIASAWLIYVVVVNYADDRATTRTLQRRYLVAGLFATALGALAFVLAKAGLDLGGANVVEYVNDAAQPVGSFGTMREPNIYGSYSAAMLVLAAGLTLLPTPEPIVGPRTARIVAMSSAVALIMSFTRGAWLGAFCGLIVLLVLAARYFGVRIRLRTLLAPVALLAVLSVALWFSPFEAAEFFRYKVRNLLNPSSSNAAVRLVAFGLAIEQFAQRPLLGWGTYSFAPLMAEGLNFRELENWQNLWIPNFALQVVHDTGVVGLLVFLALLGSIVRRGLRAARVAAATDRARAATLVALVASYCTLFVPFLFTTGFSLGYAWLLPALIGAHARIVLDGAPAEARAVSSGASVAA